MIMKEPIHIISLGAGAQSSCMALMAAKGEITPMPTAAIFADTQAEPKSVYTWLDWLEKQLPFPVIRVSRGNLAKDSLKVRISAKTGGQYVRWTIPAFGLMDSGKKVILGRQCTSDYKIIPIIRHMRKMCDWKRGEKRHLITMWIGISRDEVVRMKPSREKWIQNIWPLIDKNMTRLNCLQWMESNGYPKPPRSACTFCPFHSNAEWNKLKTESPKEFESVVVYEKLLKYAMAKDLLFKGKPFLHSSCIPIDQVDFRSESEKGGQSNLFGNECEGMCGV